MKLDQHKYVLILTKQRKIFPFDREGQDGHPVLKDKTHQIEGSLEDRGEEKFWGGKKDFAAGGQGASYLCPQWKFGS